MGACGVGPCFAEGSETCVAISDMIVARVFNRSRVERARRSTLVTISTSLVSSWSRALRSCIGIWSPNRIEWVLTQYAAAKAGLILVNINPAYRLTEVEFVLNKVECRALITADRFKTTDYIAMLRALAPELNHCDPGALRAERQPYLTTLIHMAPTEETGFYAFDTVGILVVKLSMFGSKNLPLCCSLTTRPTSFSLQAPPVCQRQPH